MPLVSFDLTFIQYLLDARDLIVCFVGDFQFISFCLCFRLWANRKGCISIGRTVWGTKHGLCNFLEKSELF